MQIASQIALWASVMALGLVLVLVTLGRIEAGRESGQSRARAEPLAMPQTQLEDTAAESPADNDRIQEADHLFVDGPHPFVNGLLEALGLENQHVEQLTLSLKVGEPGRFTASCLVSDTEALRACIGDK